MELLNKIVSDLKLYVKILLEINELMTTLNNQVLKNILVY